MDTDTSEDYNLKLTNIIQPAGQNIIYGKCNVYLDDNNEQSLCLWRYYDRDFPDQEPENQESILIPIILKKGSQGLSHRIIELPRDTTINNNNNNSESDLIEGNTRGNTGGNINIEDTTSLETKDSSVDSNGNHGNSNKITSLNFNIPYLMIFRDISWNMIVRSRSRNEKLVRFVIESLRGLKDPNVLIVPPEENIPGQDFDRLKSRLETDLRWNFNRETQVTQITQETQNWIPGISVNHNKNQFEYYTDIKIDHIKDLIIHQSRWDLSLFIIDTENNLYYRSYKIKILARIARDVKEFIIYNCKPDRFDRSTDKYQLYYYDHQDRFYRLEIILHQTSFTSCKSRIDCIDGTTFLRPTLTKLSEI